MNKFTKSMAAIAVSALIAGPAAALEFDALWTGEKAEVKLSGDGCDGAKFKKLDVATWMANEPYDIDAIGIGFDAYTTGPNTGVYEVEILGGFGVGEDFFGEGVFVISKNGKKVEDAPKKAALGMSELTFEAIEDALDAYGISECKKFDFLEFDLTQVTKGSAEWSKDGERLQAKIRVDSQYKDDDGKDKNVKVNVDTGKMDIVID